MPTKSKDEGKIMHLPPPQQFLVAHRKPLEMMSEAEGTPSTGGRFSVTNGRGIKSMTGRLLSDCWFLLTLILKRFRRLDKNLLMALVAVALLLLQVFLLVLEANAKLTIANSILKTYYQKPLTNQTKYNENETYVNPKPGEEELAAGDSNPYQAQPTPTQ